MDNLIGIIIFLSVILVIEVSNMFILRRGSDRSLASPVPMISVLIPARNEELNIRKCVTSVLAQDYDSFEVIVLDDNSEDETPDILTSLAKQNAALKIIHGSILPEAWAGKNWACHQLSEVAEGELLLFIDADTHMKTGCLRSLVRKMQDTKSDLLSALPEQEVISWGEKFIVPVMHWSILCFIPLGISYMFHLVSLSVSNGQCMCFARKAYEKIGGHAAVKNSVVEDRDLSRLVTQKGLRWRLVDGIGIISCRMYRSSQEAFDGLVKNLFPFFGYNIPFFVFVWFWLIIVFWQPIVTLVALGIGIINFDIYIYYALAGIGLAVLIWGIFYLRFGFPIYLIFLYPFTQLIISSVAIASLAFNIKGTTSWKGRVITRYKFPS